MIQEKLNTLTVEGKREAHRLIQAVALENDLLAQEALKSLLTIPALSVEEVKTFFFEKTKEAL